MSGRRQSAPVPGVGGRAPATVRVCDIDIEVPDAAGWLRLGEIVGQERAQRHAAEIVEVTRRTTLE